MAAVVAVVVIVVLLLGALVVMLRRSGAEAHSVDDYRQTLETLQEMRSRSGPRSRRVSRGPTGRGPAPTDEDGAAVSRERTPPSEDWASPVPRALDASPGNDAAPWLPRAVEGSRTEGWAAAGPRAFEIPPSEDWDFAGPPTEQVLRVDGATRSSDYQPVAPDRPAPYREQQMPAAPEPWAPTEHTYQTPPSEPLRAQPGETASSEEASSPAAHVEDTEVHPTGADGARPRLVFGDDLPDEERGGPVDQLGMDGLKRSQASPWVERVPRDLLPAVTTRLKPVTDRLKHSYRSWVKRPVRDLLIAAAAALAVVVLVVVLAVVMLGGSSTPAHHQRGASSAQASAGRAAPAHATGPTTTTTTVPPLTPQPYTASTGTYPAPSQTYTLTVGTLITARGPCWLQVTSQSGTVLASETYQPGQLQSMTVTGTTTIAVGAPSAADILINGRTLIIPPGYQTPFTMTLQPPASSPPPTAPPAR